MIRLNHALVWILWKSIRIPLTCIILMVLQEPMSKPTTAAIRDSGLGKCVYPAA